MDPDELLDHLLACLRLWKLTERAGPDEALRDISELVVADVEALNEWLAKGGFLPAAWVQATKPRTEDIDTASDDMVELAGLFSVATAREHTNRAEIRGVLQKISDLAAAIADGIALGGFPELTHNKKESD